MITGNKMETTIILGLYEGYIGPVENTMGTSIMLNYIGPVLG